MNPNTFASPKAEAALRAAHTASIQLVAARDAAYCAWRDGALIATAEAITNTEKMWASWMDRQAYNLCSHEDEDDGEAS